MKQNKRARQPRQPRSLPALLAITHCKWTPMRDRRLRRPLDARRRARELE
jgi:hypothetical protein